MVKTFVISPRPILSDKANNMKGVRLLWTNMPVLEMELLERFSGMHIFDSFILDLPLNFNL
jgi:hypothetical protein